MHTICLVTCYSEGLDSIRTTLDSVATSEYPNSHKLILVVADGIITGKGNELSTPDICLSMMKDFVVDPDDVLSYSYVAIADGQKRLNMAKVYGGFYRYDKHTVDRSKQQRVPMITIVKCGGPVEVDDPKPGNRGKRDSQIILMSFLQKVMFDERMTMLEYDLFNMIWRLTGRPPDCFELILMVDADTKIYPDSLSRLVSCMAHDPEIMGLCSETKIGNKTDSWVTMIQVSFALECLSITSSIIKRRHLNPSLGASLVYLDAFACIALKPPKDQKAIGYPILVNPDVVEHYSEYVVNTLHRKNLLLLGEDRYLSTLMLKAFPKRKMMFVPQAVCKTVVPDTFQVLLSQRRRWINSTVHKLLELVLVRDLCGTFCFSMQFIVFMELLGTFVLPAALTFTTILIIMACLGKPAVIPLLFLAVVLGLPAILIVMTSRKLIYIGWMIIYLVSLPIWNLVLPAYAFWHFDDFSLGETRQVDGEVGEKSHGDKRGEFDPSGIIMKRWEDFERERRKLEAEDEQQIDLAEADLAELRYSYQYSPSCYTKARSMSPPLSAYSHALPHQPVITLSQASSEAPIPHHLESVDEEYTDISDMHTLVVQGSGEEQESDEDFH
ncbi:Chitin synthase 3 [Bifiguratus adelaidae]|uniref:chitin synthase n=1 Tax=Bifiguratus adelaidae TaxID=1938954 RepID=A0A261Y5N4_9FUNG|nr:Chitin synthase 3 [Bifiguratus adelaidae]